jgi:hypothetical protein
MLLGFIVVAICVAFICLDLQHTHATFNGKPPLTFRTMGLALVCGIFWPLVIVAMIGAMLMMMIDVAEAG